MERIELTLAEDSALGTAGQKVMLALTPTDVHVAEELPSYLAGYSAPGFRADEASKVILVDNDTDKYRASDANDAFQPVQVKASVQQAVPEVDPKTNLNTYQVVDRFIGSFIPTVTELNEQKAFRTRQAAMKRCKRAIQIDREIDVWTLLGTNTNFASGNRIALGATEYWADSSGVAGTTSDPILALQRVMEASVFGPVEFWMNLRVANAFIRHPKVKDHYRMLIGDSPLQGTVSQLNVANAAGAALDFQIPAIGVVHVVNGKYKNSGSTYTPFLADTVVVATHSPEGVPTDAEDIATSFTFRRRGPSGVGFETREFFVENRGPNGGTMIVTSMADIAVMTANSVGGIITAVTV